MTGRPISPQVRLRRAGPGRDTERWGSWPRRRADSELTFELLGDPEVTGGAGGWEDVPRPRRRTATEWVGTPPLAQVLPLLLDGTEVGPGIDVSVESQCRRLLAWANPHKGDDPPALRLAGPVAHTGVRWVIGDIGWGPALRDVAGRRIQQEVTLTLLEYVEAKVARGPAAASRKRRGK